jgi:hypothetical protein
MDGVAFFTVLALALQGGLGSGGAGGDLVSFVPTDAYLQSRRIPVNVKNLLDLAMAEPKDGKTQIRQLVALRALAEKPELSKKERDEVLRTVAKIAKGEIARDRLGFSQEYARRTLRALGGKVAPAKEAPPADLRAEALGWFPADTTLVGFIGGLPREEAAGDPGARFRELLTRRVRPRSFDEFFTLAERVGNVRVDRIGIAAAQEDKAGARSWVYVRVTGKWDRERLVAVFETGIEKIGLPAGVAATRTAAKGTPVTTLQGPLGLALVGDTDLLVVFRGDDTEFKTDQKALRHILAVRAGTETSLLEGALLPRLPDISRETVALFVGDFGAAVRAAGERFQLPTPKSVRLVAVRSGGGISVRLQAGLANADEADTYVDVALAQRKTKLGELEDLEFQFKAYRTLPREGFASIRKSLERAQLRSDGAVVKGAVAISSEGSRILFWLMMRLTLGGEDPPPADEPGQ